MGAVCRIRVPVQRQGVLQAGVIRQVVEGTFYVQIPAISN